MLERSPLAALTTGLSDTRVRKASNRAEQVAVYTYSGNASRVWWQQIETKVARFANLSVYEVAPDTVAALAGMVERKGHRLDAMMQGGSVLFPGAQEFIRPAAAVVPIAIASGALRHEIDAIVEFAIANDLEIDSLARQEHQGDRSHRGGGGVKGMQHLLRGPEGEQREADRQELFLVKAHRPHFAQRLPDRLPAAGDLLRLRRHHAHHDDSQRSTM